MTKPTNILRSAVISLLLLTSGPAFAKNDLPGPGVGSLDVEYDSPTAGILGEPKSNDDGNKRTWTFDVEAGLVASLSGNAEAGGTVSFFGNDVSVEGKGGYSHNISLRDSKTFSVDVIE